MDEKPKRLRGRPRKPPAEHKRGSYSFRMGEDVRDQLMAAAQKAGRSLSEEIEHRLVDSLGPNDCMKSALRELLNEGRSPHNYLIDEAYFQDAARPGEMVEIKLGGAKQGDEATVHVADREDRDIWRLNS